MLLGGDGEAAAQACNDFVSSTDPSVLLACGIVFERLGRTNEADRVRRRLASQPDVSAELAQWQAAGKNPGNALPALERLAKTEDVAPGLAFDPVFDGS